MAVCGPFELVRWEFVWLWESVGGLVRPSGAVASTLLLVILSGGLYLLFKRLDWL